MKKSILLLIFSSFLLGQASLLPFEKVATIELNDSVQIQAMLFLSDEGDIKVFTEIEPGKYIDVTTMDELSDVILNQIFRDMELDILTDIEYQIEAYDYDFYYNDWDY